MVQTNFQLNDFEKINDPLSFVRNEIDCMGTSPIPDPQSLMCNRDSNNFQQSSQIFTPEFRLTQRYT